MEAAWKSLAPPLHPHLHPPRKFRPKEGKWLCPELAGGWVLEKL